MILLKNKIQVDFHLHSEFSPDSLSPLDALHQRAKEIGLGKIIITDHDTTRGAEKLQPFDPTYVIVGEEIQTTSGEILAFFVQEEIPTWLNPLDALKRLKEQGAFISLSHPFATTRATWSPTEMIEYKPYLDAIEIYNSRNSHRSNQKAVEFAAAHGLAGTAGSDGHALGELGKMGLELPKFHTAEELREAIQEAIPFGTESSPLVSLYSRYAVLKKKFSS